MVQESQHEESNGAPPPLDESWWQAVLAEEERLTVDTDDLSEIEQRHPRFETPLEEEAGVHPIDWETAYRLYELDESISLKVTGYNRGGLLVNGTDLQGFVPVSHLVGIQDCAQDTEDKLKEYFEKILQLKIIECDKARGRVVFSERAALSEPGQRNLLLNNLKPGDCICGRVTNITDFGLFVDLGGIEGLVHVSEISWGRVQHPADVVTIGQEIEVYVIHIDLERTRVALSLKRLNPNPWLTADRRYEPGQVIEAVVTSVVPFGAFARLEEGLDGLIHISEMGKDGSVNHPGQVLREGQRVQVRVLQVDCKRQRLGLSMDLDQSPPEADAGGTVIEDEDNA